MNEWPEFSLDQLCGGKGTYGIVASASAGRDHKFLRTTDMIDGKIEWSRVPSSDAAPDKREKYLLHHGDLVISRTGANAGAVAFVNNPPEGSIFAGYLVRFSVDPNLADSRFVYYQLSSSNWREYVQSTRSGSAQPQFNAQKMGSFRLNVPPLREQQRIAGVLGALDDLIDTNDKLAARCKDLRSAIVSEALNNAPDSAPLTDFANFVNGKNFTKHAAGTGTPIIRTPEVRNGVAASTPRSPVAADKSNIAQNGDTLLVWSGSLMVSRWVGEDALINQHIFKVIPTQAPDWLVHGLVEFQMDWFLGLAADKATTMGHIQRGHLDAPVPKLAENVITQLGVQVVPLWDSEIELKVENESLRCVRDELLPLLMSGKIRVREAEEVVASVTKGDG